MNIKGFIGYKDTCIYNFIYNTIFYNTNHFEKNMMNIQLCTLEDHKHCFLCALFT